MNTMLGLQLSIFSLSWIFIIYLINCAIAREWKRIQLQHMLLYVCIVAMIGVFGELFLDTVYNFFVGRPLWTYNILPIFNGYTSRFAFVVWAMYGFHLYLLHDSLHAKWGIRRTRYVAGIMAVEALILEAAVTISAKIFLGEYLYYYTPGDMWHVTSIQNMPFYFICGVLVYKTIQHTRHSPRFFSILALFLASTLVFFAS